MNVLHAIITGRWTATYAAPVHHPYRDMDMSASLSMRPNKPSPISIDDLSCSRARACSCHASDSCGHYHTTDCMTPLSRESSMGKNDTNRMSSVPYSVQCDSSDYEDDDVPCGRGKRGLHDVDDGVAFTTKRFVYST